MSVFSDASAALGVPAWAVPVCLGIVGLAKLVDGSMRPEAKAEIGDFLDQGGIPGDAAGVTGIVNAAFLATFGDRQWTWRCLQRTMLLSVFAVYAICLLVWAKHGGEIRSRMPDLPSLPAMIAASLPGVLLVSVVLNWVSVAKTRLILRRMRSLRGLAGLIAFMALDLLLTYALMAALYWGPRLLVFGRSELCDTTRYYHPAADCGAFDSVPGVLAGIVGVTASMIERMWSEPGSLTPGNILNVAEGCATLLTSIWTVLIVLAMAVLRGLSPLASLRRLVRWGFDLRASPVMAVGWMVAVLVWLGSLAYAIA